MDRKNVKFKAISLNVRCIRAFEKRMSILNWLINQSAGISFLQETYSTVVIANHWRKQWPGEFFFRMVLIRAVGWLSLFISR